jgi:hypothetical protein
MPRGKVNPTSQDVSAKSKPDVLDIFNLPGDNEEDAMVEETTTSPTQIPVIEPELEPLDSSINMDKLQKGVVNTGGGGFGVFLKLKDKEKKEIFFLDEWNEGKWLARHQDWDKGIRLATCFKHYGQKCPLCDQGVPLQDWFVWNIYNFTDKQVQILAFKRLYKGGVVRQIGEFAEQNGSIKTVNWIVQREGEKTATQYNATPKTYNPENMKKILAYMKQFEEQKFNLLEALKPQLTSGGTEEPIEEMPELIIQ